LRPDEYAQQDAVGLCGLMRTRTVAAAEVQLAARQALEAADAELNGLAMPLFSSALDHAADGPLGGVPFLIKDVPMARGVPFCIGSRSLEGLVADHDSDLMTRFKAAGLVTLGVTTVPEMAISFSAESVKHGPTRNPWDPARGVGGSSGGAGALVAAGGVPIAHGNDGAGSLRIPASCCGLVGLKPSWADPVLRSTCCESRVDVVTGTLGAAADGSLPRRRTRRASRAAGFGPRAGVRPRVCRASRRQRTRRVPCGPARSAAAACCSPRASPR